MHCLANSSLFLIDLTNPGVIHGFIGRYFFGIVISEVEFSIHLVILVRKSSVISSMLSLEYMSDQSISPVCCLSLSWSIFLIIFSFSISMGSLLSILIAAKVL
uniref:Uncharacterized protein n=1 Tax=Cacopsylla melanoneura TaxID=428564 RepID=A0A8D8R3G8_9HEMI